MKLPVFKSFRQGICIVFLMTGIISSSCFIISNEANADCGNSVGVGRTFKDIDRIVVDMRDVQRGGTAGWYPEKAQPQQLKSIIAGVIDKGLYKCVAEDRSGNKKPIIYLIDENENPFLGDKSVLIVYVSSQYFSHPNYEKIIGVPSYMIINAGFYRSGPSQNQFDNLRLMKQRVFFLEKEGNNLGTSIESFLSGALTPLKSWPQPGSLVQWKD